MTARPPSPGEYFAFRPDPAEPGWYASPAAASGQFIDIFGPLRIHAESATIARIRLLPEQRHCNVIGTVHGGYLMAVVDQVLFLGPMALGIANVRGAVTVDASMQFLAPVRPGIAFDAVVELLRETGRMLFLRGLIEQEGVRAAAFSGTLRKARPDVAEPPPE